jgi:recombination protein RecT
MTQTNLPAARHETAINLRAPASDSGQLKSLLNASKDRLAEVLPKHLNPDRMMRVALAAIGKSELLQKCTIGSILQCVMTGGQLGLDCSGVLGSAYMVPFWNSKINSYEAVFIPGYRGLIDLARRSKEIDDISANVVYSGDVFEFELGATPRLKHVPNFTAERRDEDIVGAYMVAFLRGNERPHIEFMTRGDIEKTRASSKGAFDKAGNAKGPWRDWFSEMCRKSVVRRGIKYLPMSVEVADALLADDAAETRTEVFSASTPERTGNLAQKLSAPTIRYEPSDEAAEAIDAETGEVVAQAVENTQQAAAEAIDAETGEVQPTAGNPHAGKDQAESLRREALASDLSGLEWGHFVTSWQTALGDRVSATDFQNGVKLLAGKRKVEAIGADERARWVRASLDGRLNWLKGMILPGPGK